MPSSGGIPAAGTITPAQSSPTITDAALPTQTEVKLSKRKVMIIHTTGIISFKKEFVDISTFYHTCWWICELFLRICSETEKMRILI